LIAMRRIDTRFLGRAVAALATLLLAVLPGRPVPAAEFSVEDEYVDAKQLADAVRPMEAGPLRTVFLSRFQLIESEYLPRAQRFREIDATARDAIARHERAEKEFLDKLQAIRGRSSEDTGPGSAWRTGLAEAATGYRTYLAQWQSRRTELLAAHTAAKAELEKSRAPLTEFQAVYNAVKFRRVAYKPGMTWAELADARLIASSAPQCDAAKAPTAEGAPATPYMTLYRPLGGERWERRRDLGAVATEVAASDTPKTIVCVREVHEIVGRYRDGSSGLGPAAVSVQWHIALVRAADGQVVATKVLYGTPPPDTATVYGKPINAPSISGKPPTPAELAEWIARRATPRR
jgi:hypothetical protein